jgi:molybdopterin converting factor small subunit
MTNGATTTNGRALTRVHLPLALREEAGGAAALDVACATVAEALEAVCTAHPTLRRHILDERGAPRRHVNVFVNEDDARARGGMATPVSAGDVIHIVPSIAGG